MKVCPKHGEYEPEVVSHPLGFRWEAMCPGCQEDEARAAKQDEERRRAAIASERMRLAGITPRFQGVTFDGYDAQTPEQQRVLRICRAYSDPAKQKIIMSKGVSLIMIGLPGTGKNHLATCIVRAYIDGGYSARIIRLGEMVREIRSTYAGEGNERGAYDRFTKYDLLVVNEVGVQSGTEAERNVIFEIFDNRYESMKPTIVISNQDLEGLKRFLGDRVVDRLQENGGLILNFTWKSHRLLDPKAAQ